MAVGLGVPEQRLGVPEQRLGAPVRPLVDIADARDACTEKVRVVVIYDAAEHHNPRRPDGGRHEYLANLKGQRACLKVCVAQAVADRDLERGTVDDHVGEVADVVRLEDAVAGGRAVCECQRGGVRAVVPDGPEQRTRRGGGAGELRGENGVQLAAAAREGGEVVREVAAVAGIAFGEIPGNAEEDLVGEAAERHGGGCEEVPQSSGRFVVTPPRRVSWFRAQGLGFGLGFGFHHQ